MSDSTIGIVDTLAAAASAGVVVIVLRDAPETLQDIDEVDVLINPSDLAQLLEITAKNGWCVQDVGAFMPHKVALCRYHDGRLIKIGVYCEFVDGPHVYMNRAMAMRRRRPGQWGLYYLSKDDWIAHVVVHTILREQALSDRYLERLQEATQFGIDRYYIRDQLSLYGLSSLARHINRSIVGGLRSREKVAALRKHTRRQLRRNVPNLLRELSFRSYWVFGCILGLRPGFSVAFLGPDGVGQSDAMSAFAAALQRMGMASRVAFMGPWDHSVSPTRSIVRRFGLHPLEPYPPDPKTIGLKIRCMKIFIRRQVFYLHTFLDGWARYFLLVWPHTRLRRIVLWDRSMIDLLVGYDNTPIPNSAALRERLFKFSPKPDITIVLDADAEKIWARSENIDIELITQALSRYRELARANNYTLLRTDLPSEQMVERFMAQHWREFIQRRRDRPFFRFLCSRIVALASRAAAISDQARGTR